MQKVECHIMHFDAMSKSQCIIMFTVLCLSGNVKCVSDMGKLLFAGVMPISLKMKVNFRLSLIHCWIVIKQWNKLENINQAFIKMNP